MKMNKKGFTLIELLAIIVILAIIAVITVPIILNIIENARAGAAKNSVIGYGKAVELAYTQYQYETQMNSSYVTTGSTVVQSVDLGTGATATSLSLGVDFDGDAVTGCQVTINNGIITMEGCMVGSYGPYTYSGGKITDTQLVK